MNALIIVDVQNDFTPATEHKPAGALAVPEGNAVVPVINALIPRFARVVATQDWHPPGHRSFASQHPGRAVGDVIDLDGLEQVLWPDHCVQDTFGAEFVAELNTAGIHHVVRKGTDRDIDSYSGFFDNGHRKATGLAEDLRAHGIRTVYIVGLATDYCVKYTALDARLLGYEVYVIPEACRGVNLAPDHVDRALEQMRDAGVRFVKAAAVSG